MKDRDPWVQQVIQDKALFGWNLVKLGIIAISWELCQIEYKRQNLSNTPTNDGVKWSNRMQGGIWEYTSGAWFNRNEHVHGKTIEVEQRIKNEKLNKVI